MKKKISFHFFLVLFFALATLSGAPKKQVKIQIILSIPYALPLHSTIYLSGNSRELGKWQADFIPLTKLSARKYRTVFTLPKGGKIQFKFTLGSWKMVEKGPRGEEVQNRILALDRSKTVSFQVYNWNNTQLLRSRIPTWKGTVEEIGPLYSSHFKNWRKIWVYLPPSYKKNNTRRYPVLYMHDGNNVFDAKRSFGGFEWGVDETVEALIARGKLQEIIVVAVANTSRRMAEYTPVRDIFYGGGEADSYADFLVKQVKPRIDRLYRTKKGRKYTGVMGSSLGGLVSLYLALKYPKVFSKIGVVSPSLWWSNQWILTAVRQNKFKDSFQIWVDMGTREGSRDQNKNAIPDSLEEARQLRDILVQKGFVHNKTLAYHEEKGGQHNEYYWSKRVWRPLSFFWGK